MRRKRAEQETSPASRSKLSRASGSRSIATSVPADPRRAAMRRAWPPSPNVQSIAVCPGRGASSSTSSTARTGTWERAPSAASRGRRPPAPPRRGRRGADPRRERVISSSVIEARRDLLHFAEQLGRVLGPAVPAPELQTGTGAHDDDVLLDRRVPAEEGRHDYPPGRVELGVDRVAEEEALHFAEPGRERGQRVQRAAAVALVVVRMPDADARFQVHRERQHHAVGERCAVAGGHGEAVLRIERVVEGAAKEGQSGAPACGSSRGGGVGGTPPPRLAWRDPTPLSPTLQP